MTARGKLPDRILQDLWTRTIARLRPVHVETTQDGTITAINGSRPETLGLPALEPGQPVAETLFALEGILPIGQPIELPAIEIADGKHIDIRVTPDGDRVDIILTDATADVQFQRKFQQRGNELSLLTQELERRNTFIRSVFGRYVSDALVEELLDKPDGLSLSGDTRTVTILLSDIRGFTPLCTRLPAPDVVRLLNRYLGEMTEIMLKHGATISEFIGDAILAVFGIPRSDDDDARRAILCAIDMQNAMDRVNAWAAENDLPHIEMGIGLNTGEVVVGNIGSARRLKYSVIGSPVNLAARAESHTSGRQIFATRTTVDAAGPGVISRAVLKVSPKGFEKPIELFDVTGFGPPFDVCVPERTAQFEPLKRPLLMRLRQIENKQVQGAELSGPCRNLSRSGAIVTLDSELPRLTELQLRAHDDDLGAIPGSVYARVVDVRGDEGHAPNTRVWHHILRFTAIPPVFEDFLRWRLMSGATPGDEAQVEAALSGHWRSF